MLLVLAEEGLVHIRPHVCKPTAKGTIRGIHAILSGVFEAAMRWEWTDRNPAASARSPTPRRQTILATSPEDVAKVIAEARACSAALGLYLWLVMVTGVRRVRKDTKTHQDRWLAIDPVTCALIVSYLALPALAGQVRGSSPGRG
jgi:hypothetical protein